MTTLLCGHLHLLCLVVSISVLSLKKTTNVCNQTWGFCHHLVRGQQKMKNY